MEVGIYVKRDKSATWELIYVEASDISTSTVVLRRAQFSENIAAPYYRALITVGGAPFQLLRSVRLGKYRLLTLYKTKRRKKEYSQLSRTYLSPIFELGDDVLMRTFFVGDESSSPTSEIIQSLHSLQSMNLSNHLCGYPSTSLNVNPTINIHRKRPPR